MKTLQFSNCGRGITLYTSIIMPTLYILIHLYTMNIDFVWCGHHFTFYKNPDFVSIFFCTNKLQLTKHKMQHYFRYNYNFWCIHEKIGVLIISKNRRVSADENFMYISVCVYTFSRNNQDSIVSINCAGFYFISHSQYSKL